MADKPLHGMRKDEIIALFDGLRVAVRDLLATMQKQKGDFDSLLETVRRICKSNQGSV